MSGAPASAIAFVDLAARHRAVGAAVEEGVLEVLRSGRYIGGPVVDALEEQLAARNGRRFGVSCNSGTDALTLALQAVGVGPGHEVIVPAVSFYATLEAVLRVGAEPVVVDVLEGLPLIDPAAVRAARTPRTRAVVPVHLFGAAAPDLGTMGLLVVDDAAQAVVGDPPRSRGLATAMSFYPTKVLGAAGDGGLVLTDDPGVAMRLRALGSHGPVGPDRFDRVGGHVAGNSRLDAVQAAILLAHLGDLDRRIARRREVAAAYAEALPELAVPHDPTGCVGTWCLRHPHRDRLAQALSAEHIETRVYYRVPLSRQPVLPPQAPTPRADAFCATTLALPCHAGLSEEDVARVIDAVGRHA